MVLTYRHRHKNIYFKKCWSFEKCRGCLKIKETEPLDSLQLECGLRMLLATSMCAGEREAKGIRVGLADHEWLPSTRSVHTVVRLRNRYRTAQVTVDFPGPRRNSNMTVKNRFEAYSFHARMPHKGILFGKRFIEKRWGLCGPHFVFWWSNTWFKSYIQIKRKFLTAIFQQDKATPHTARQTL